MSAKFYQTKPEIVSAWNINGEELAQCVINKTPLPLDLELLSYKFTPAKNDLPARLDNFKFLQIRNRFKEGDYIVLDLNQNFAVLSPSDFELKYVPAS
jgi:hypothetical protein